MTAEIFPLRFGPSAAALAALPPEPGTDAALMQSLVDHGLRAQLRTGNLLTGQLYVALDFQPGRAPCATAAR